MDIKFLLPAEQEFFEAIDFLESESIGLGNDFASEVMSTLERIVQFPRAWRTLSKRTHICNTKRFPYSIVYQIRSNFILIVAVLHQHRDPKTWKERIT